MAGLFLLYSRTKQPPPKKIKQTHTTKTNKKTNKQNPPHTQSKTRSTTTVRVSLVSTEKPGILFLSLFLPSSIPLEAN